MVSAMKLIVSGWGIFLEVKNGMISIKNGEYEKEVSAGDVNRVVIATKGLFRKWLKS